MFDDEATQGIDSEDLLAELEQQTQTEVHRSREGSATTLSTEIQLRLAGASHDTEPAQCGKTLEISKLSILANCEQSPLVGDIFESASPAMRSLIRRFLVSVNAAGSCRVRVTKLRSSCSAR
jgi:hypothetical protein